MRIALISDIHSNLEALQACLRHTQKQGVDRYAVLGDLVGYGADPIAVVERIASLRDAGAIVLMGNHDEAIIADEGTLNSGARSGVMDAAAIVAGAYGISAWAAAPSTS